MGPTSSEKSQPLFSQTAMSILDEIACFYSTHPELFKSKMAVPTFRDLQDPVSVDMVLAGKSIYKFLVDGDEKLVQILKSRFELVRMSYENYLPETEAHNLAWKNWNNLNDMFSKRSGKPPLSFPDNIMQ